MRKGKEFWRRHVKEWNESGLSAREYSARAEVNVHTLQGWRSRLAREERGKTRNQFVEVVPIPVLAPSAKTETAVAPLEIVVRGCHRVLVRNDFEPTLLRRVLAVLEER